MTALYRAQMDTILAADVKGKDILVRSETFSKEQVEKLLAKPGCTQLRIYYGMSQDLKIHALLVGVNEKGEDILGNTQLSNNDDSILEEAQRCPPSCPPASALNS
jgi:hypothetical protein